MNRTEQNKGRVSKNSGGLLLQPIVEEVLKLRATWMKLVQLHSVFQNES